MFAGNAVRYVRILLGLLLLSGTLTVLYVARSALFPFVLGTALAYLVLPLVDWLDRHLPLASSRAVFRRTLSILLVFAVVLILLAGALAFLVLPVTAQVRRLFEQLPELAERAYRAVPVIGPAWLEWYNTAVPELLRAAIERGLEGLVAHWQAALRLGVFGTLRTLSIAINLVLGFFLVPLWVFFFLKDQPRLSAAWSHWLPATYREDLHAIGALINGTLGSYLRGQIILCLSVGLMSTAGFLALGIDFALLLGLLAGLFEAIPIVGPLLGAVPALWVALATFPQRVPHVIVMALVVQQIENVFLVPMVTGETVDLHPALVMMLLVLGSALAGVPGVILAVPLTALGRDVLRYLRLRLADSALPPQEALRRVRERH